MTREAGAPRPGATPAEDEPVGAARADVAAGEEPASAPTAEAEESAWTVDDGLTVAVSVGAEDDGQATVPTTVEPAPVEPVELVEGTAEDDAAASAGDPGPVVALEPADATSQPDDEPAPNGPVRDDPRAPEKTLAEGPGEEPSAAKSGPEPADLEAPDPETPAPETPDPETPDPGPDADPHPQPAADPTASTSPAIEAKDSGSTTSACDVRESEPGTESDEPEPDAVAAKPIGWAAVTAALRPHPATRGQALAGVLCAVLGFSLVVQVHQVNTSGLSALRQADLVQVLARVTGESARLEEEAAGLQQARERLADGDVDRAAAGESARQRLQVLAILAGTAPARGPGLKVVITDPKGRVGAAELLDAVQELRDAGAEAMQIEGAGRSVRIVASTSFVDEDGGLRTGGALLRAPFTLRVLGDPDTLSAALTIPGGVDDVLRGLGSEVSVAPERDLLISALAPQVQYRYARPTG